MTYNNRNNIHFDNECDIQMNLRDYEESHLHAQFGFVTYCPNCVFWFIKSSKILKILVGKPKKNKFVVI